MMFLTPEKSMASNEVANINLIVTDAAASRCK